MGNNFAIGLILNLLQLVLILFHKPLRSWGQLLVFMVTLTDALKNLTHAAIAIKRLYQLFTGSGGIDTQRNCMLMLVATNIFTERLSIAAFVILSLDRTIAMAFPVWYKTWKVRCKKVMLSAGLVAVIIDCSCAVIGTSSEVLNVACTVGGLSTPAYFTYFVWSNNASSIAITIINVSTSIILFAKWRRVVKMKGNVDNFKRDIGLNALKCVMGLVIVYLVTVVAGSVFDAAVISSNLDVATKTALGPVIGAVYLMRGGFDLFVYLMFSQEYRNAFRDVVLKMKCRYQVGPETTPVIPMS